MTIKCEICGKTYQATKPLAKCWTCRREELEREKGESDEVKAQMVIRQWNKRSPEQNLPYRDE